MLRGGRNPDLGDKGIEAALLSPQGKSLSNHAALYSFLETQEA
jgi:hypothetical protein